MSDVTGPVKLIMHRKNNETKNLSDFNIETMTSDDARKLIIYDLSILYYSVSDLYCQFSLWHLWCSEEL